MYLGHSMNLDLGACEVPGVEELAMAMSVQRTLDGRSLDPPKTRKSYTREFKLDVVKFYCKNNLAKEI